MEKLVYLYELDSVRNTDHEIHIAMRALYDEIYLNGNIVVISFNQLIESRIFVSLLQNHIWSERIIKLFSSGAIRFNMYGDKRTPSQYLIESFTKIYDKEITLKAFNKMVNDNKRNKFIYSNLPLKSSQRSLLHLAARCLQYSDLSELNSYRKGGSKTDYDREMLFRELNLDIEEMKQQYNEMLSNSCADPDKKISCIYKIDIFEPHNKDDESRRNNQFKQLDDLYKLLSLVLKLSDIDQCYNPPKAKDENSASLNLQFFINHALSLEEVSLKYKGKAVNWADVKLIINDANVDEGDNRSDLHENLRRAFEQKREEALRPKYSLAEMVVDLCYNYRIEAGIHNISLHYDLDALSRKADADPSSFEKDFRRRLLLTWNNGYEIEKRFLQKETTEFQMYAPRFWDLNLVRAARMKEYRNNFHDMINDFVDWFWDNAQRERPIKSKKTDVSRYEKHLLQNRVLNYIPSVVYLLCAFLPLILYLNIAYWFENIFNKFAEGQVENWVQQNFSVLSAVYVVFIIQILTVLVDLLLGLIRDHNSSNPLMKYFRLPSLSDALEICILRIYDLIWIMGYHISLWPITLLGIIYVINSLHVKNVYLAIVISFPVWVIFWSAVRFIVPYFFLYRRSVYMNFEIHWEAIKQLFVTKKSYSTRQCDQQGSYNYISPNIKQYQSLQKERKDLFVSSTANPIVDITQEGNAVRLTRLEEMTGKKFGVVYSSPDYYLVVDPIGNFTDPEKVKSAEGATQMDNIIRSQERLIPSAKLLRCRTFKTSGKTKVSWKNVKSIKL